MLFDLGCCLAGHIPTARYTRTQEGELVSNCTRCGRLILKPLGRRWMVCPARES